MREITGSTQAIIKSRRDEFNDRKNDNDGSALVGRREIEKANLKEKPEKGKIYRQIKVVYERKRVCKEYM